MPTQTGQSLIRELTDNSPDGTHLGQSTTDLISFYGATPVVQPTNSADAVTQLVALGLLSAGAYNIVGALGSASNNVASAASSLSGIVPQGWTKVNSSVAKTYYLTAPVSGAEKFLYEDAISTATVTIKVNSTDVSSSLVFISVPGTLLNTSGSSIGNIVMTNTTVISGAGITLVGVSSLEWVVKNTQSTIITYTT